MEREEPTGKRRYRIGTFGVLILQVEVTKYWYREESLIISSHTYWRDARVEDVTLEDFKV